MADYPLAPRVLAGAGALVVALFFGVFQALAVLEMGLQISAAVLVAVTLPLVLFLGGIAIAPATTQRVLRRFTRVDLHDPAEVGAAVLMAGTLYFVIGYGSLFSGVATLEMAGRGAEVPGVTGEDIFFGLGVNLLVLILPPLLYVSFVNDHGPLGALRALGLRSEGLGRALLIGAATAIGFIVLIAAVSFLLTNQGVEVPENDRALEIARSITVLGAVALAVGSSISEEVFFRGFLQPRVGLLGQAVIFSLAHLNYANLVQTVVTFLLGLAFGVLLRQTKSLWAPIAAHFTFNLLMLLAGIYAPPAA